MGKSSLERKLTRQMNKLERERQHETRVAHRAAEQQRAEVAASEVILDPEFEGRTEWIEARYLYMQLVPMTRIAAETGIDLEELKKVIYGSWKRTRDQALKLFNEEIKTTHLAAIQKSAGLCLSIINRSLEHFVKQLAVEGKEPSLYDAEQVAGIFSKLHKAKVIEAMDDNEKARLGMSPRDVLRELGRDPYLRKAISMHAKDDTPDEALEQKEEVVESVKNADSESLAHPRR